MLYACLKSCFLKMHLKMFALLVYLKLNDVLTEEAGK